MNWRSILILIKTVRTREGLEVEDVKIFDWTEPCEPDPPEGAIGSTMIYEEEAAYGVTEDTVEVVRPDGSSAEDQLMRDMGVAPSPDDEDPDG